MKPVSPVALLLFGLLLFGLFPALAEAEAPRTDGTTAAEASLKAAQAEAGRLETLRRSLSAWKADAGATANRLHNMKDVAMKLAMAATEDSKRWQQAQADWHGEDNAKVLAEQAAKFQGPPPDAGDSELPTAIASLRERLATARRALTDFNKAGLSGQPEQRGQALDLSQRLLTALSGAAQASDALATQLAARLTRLDTRLLLLRSQSAALHQPTLPQPQGKKP